MSVTPCISLNRLMQTVTVEALSLQIGICELLDVLYCSGETPMGTADQTLKLEVGSCTRCMNSSTIPMQVPAPHPTEASALSVHLCFIFGGGLSEASAVV